MYLTQNKITTVETDSNKKRSINFVRRSICILKLSANINKKTEQQKKSFIFFSGPNNSGSKVRTLFNCRLYAG